MLVFITGVFMIFVFGAIPFTDAMIVRYVDDRMRSRVTGMRLAIGFGVSSLVVAAIGPSVKAAGFPTLLMSLAGVAACTMAAISFLPSEKDATRLDGAQARGVTFLPTGGKNAQASWMLAGAAGWTSCLPPPCARRPGPASRSRSSFPIFPAVPPTLRAASWRRGWARLLGQQVIVENKGGGNTIIGMETVAKSKPDGYTLLLGSTTLATNAALGLKQPFDPLKDFQTISSIADIPDMIAVNKDLPIKDYASFVEWMNKQPDKVRFACSGVGNQPHLWGELFKSRNKLKMEVVGYKGSADAIRDVMGGHVPILVDVVLPSGAHVSQGRMTGVCVAAAERSAMCPAVPTVVELGMPDLVSAVFYGIAAPAGVPSNVVERLNGLCLQIVKDEGVKKKFAELGFVTTGSTPQGYHDKLVFETERWTKVVKDNNIKIEG